MQIKVYIDSGANIHSRKEEIINIEELWDITDDEWEDMDEDEKFGYVKDWADNYLDIGWEEV